ncbi:hypothetical protein [Gordonia malaquae]|uniref:hypothetical protein n=1 Tax=Gordonia malaquae TaxID=410332 RepID=UPI0030FEFC93
MDIDLSQMVQANSDQVNAADLVRPVTVTITRLEHGPDEKQKLNIYTDVFGDKPWRPCLTVRRLISKIWGTQGSAYIGRSLTIYNDPSVTFGRDTTGGIRVSHMSDIDGTQTVRLPVRRGQMGSFTIEPLTVDAIQSKIPVDIEARIEAMADLDKLTAMIDWLGKLAGEDEHRVAELVDLVHARIAAVEPSADDAQQTIQQELGAEEVSS